MSSYLSFYLVPKVEDDSKPEPIRLISYSRCSDIYQYFYDNIHPAYIEDSEGNTQYTELTVARVDEVISDLKNNIDKAKKRVVEYEKQAAGNTEIIDYIIEQKEWIEDLEWALHKIEFIKDIVVETGYGYAGFTKVLCNVD